MDAAFTAQRIAAKKALILLYDDALIALATDGIESYKIDTGQDSQWVTVTSAAEVNKIIQSLENQCATLQTRLNGSGVMVVGPAW